jgi:hypothetical protein
MVSSYLSTRSEWIRQLELNVVKSNGLAVRNL